MIFYTLLFQVSFKTSLSQYLTRPLCLLERMKRFLENNLPHVIRII